MAFLIQHGWGRGSAANDKIRRSLAGDIASGVVFAPDSESPENLEAYVQDLRAEYPDAQLLIDPQVYVATLDSPNYKRLVDYQDRYFEVNLGRGDFRPRFIQRLVRRTMDWQIAQGVSGVICPGVRILGFGSPMAQINMALAQEACDIAQEESLGKPLYATVAASDDSFADVEAMNEYLDELTALDVQGFYVMVFQKGAVYRRSLAEEVLSNVLAFIYSLGEVNRYEVIMGYADLNGYLYRSVGASAFCSGWYQSLRRLSEEKWAQRTGGARPLPRYTSLQLLNSLAIDPELRRIHEQGQISRVLCNSPFDSVFDGSTPPSQVTWNDFSDHMHYLYVCSQVDRMSSAANLATRCKQARLTLAQAALLYADLIESHNVLFGGESGSRHLGVWQVGLEEFCAQIGISL